MTIDILSAYPKNNAGMHSVNLAIFQLCQEKKLQSRFLNLEINKKTLGGEIEYVNFSALGENEKKRSVVVGWGDFIHSMKWAKNELFRQVHEKNKTDLEKVIDQWYKLYLRENVSQDRFISFGSTIYTSDVIDFQNMRYKNALSEMFKDSELIAFRDPYSISQIAYNIGFTPNLGCDCAFLLNSTPLMSLVSDNSGYKSGGYICVAFSRSGYRSEQWEIARMMSHMLNLPIVELPWLNCPDEKSFLSCLKILKNSACCVTDIYHLCVNALRECVPVLCSSKADFPRHTLNDEKKRQLLISMGLRDWLIDIEEYAAIKQSKIKRFYIDMFIENIFCTKKRSFLSEGLSYYVLSWRQKIRDIL